MRDNQWLCLKSTLLKRLTLHYDDFLKILFVIKIKNKFRANVMFWVIWYYLYNLKNAKNAQEGVLVLVMVQTNFNKSNTPQ